MPGGNRVFETLLEENEFNWRQNPLVELAPEGALHLRRQQAKLGAHLLIAEFVQRSGLHEL